MMPDPHMKSKLVSLVTALDEREQGGLKGLDIICQVSIHLFDVKAATKQRYRARR